MTMSKKHAVPGSLLIERLKRVYELLQSKELCHKERALDKKNQECDITEKLKKIKALSLEGAILISSTEFLDSLANAYGDVIEGSEYYLVKLMLVQLDKNIISSIDNMGINATDYSKLEDTTKEDVLSIVSRTINELKRNTRKKYYLDKSPEEIAKLMNPTTLN